MTSSPGLRGWSRLQSNYSTVECYRRRRQTAKQRWPLHYVYRRASNNGTPIQHASFIPGSKCHRMINQQHITAMQYLNDTNNDKQNGHLRCKILHAIKYSFLANVNSRSRSLYAISRPSVVCLPVCLWRWCTLLRRLNFSAIFFHHTIAQGLYFSGAKNRWWGTPLPPKICVQSDPPLSNSEFRQISAHSASSVIASEKSSIMTYKKSTTRFPTSHRWTVYVTPKSPKGWQKTRYCCLCQ